MSGQVNPFEHPEVWDQVEIGQKKSPGLAVVGEFKRKHEWDVKKGKGSDGATITFVGRPPATGDVTFYLWDANHFREWDTFRTLLKYDATKTTVQAVDIWHPSLADIGINSVVTEGIGNITHEGKGMYSIKVDFLEYFPAAKKSAVGTPSGSQSTQKGTTPGTPSDPIADAQQKEIARLMKIAAEP